MSNNTLVCYKTLWSRHSCYLTRTIQKHYGGTSKPPHGSATLQWWELPPPIINKNNNCFFPTLLDGISLTGCRSKIKCTLKRHNVNSEYVNYLLWALLGINRALGMTSLYMPEGLQGTYPKYILSTLPAKHEVVWLDEKIWLDKNVITFKISSGFKILFDIYVS